MLLREGESEHTHKIVFVNIKEKLERETDQVAVALLSVQKAKQRIFDNEGNAKKGSHSHTL
jgi:hypothetical protein